MMRICRRCSSALTVENQYATSHERKDHICKKCLKTKTKVWAEGNPAKRKKYMAQWKKDHQDYSSEYFQERKSFVTELKRGTPCKDCGGFFPPECMDFDHLPGTGKLQTVSQIAAYGKTKKVLDEIAKCEIVCANCHRIRTKKRRTAKSPVLRDCSTSDLAPRDRMSDYLPGDS